IMKEFRDGLILFRLMEDSVWTAAAQDTAAVQAYYEAHRDEYQFGDRTRIIEIFSPLDSVLTAIDAQLDSGADLATITASFDERTSQYVTIDTLMVEGATNSIYDQVLSMSEGERTDKLEHRRGLVILIHAGVDPARPKTFEEARTEAANDYQQVLEDQLMSRLHDKYEVQTYPQRLVRAFSEDTSMSSDATDAME
ncbi:MAG TPA: peptidylprolyl isomerase, partial [Rhodothermales bacterium]|nr:peptidylprolyl isomerase [Rhodothermales bacterium]